MQIYSPQRLAAIGFIFICTSVAWVILGNTISLRTGDLSERLKPRVVSTWGSPQEQRPPVAHPAGGQANIELPLEASDIKVDLALEHRQKGLIWYSTYQAGFDGVWTFRNSSGDARSIVFSLPFPADKALLEGVTLELNGNAMPVQTDGLGVFAEAQLSGQESARFRVAYRSRGLGSWRYKLSDQIGQARNFRMTMNTNFADVDFPNDTLSPTSSTQTAAGRQLAWNYSNLISGFAIGMTMPDKLQPGPLAGAISYFAPVSLLLFFFVMLVITMLRGIDLHPMNYFFLACSFFAFHLLLAYLVDHISIHAAFAICSVVSVGLVVSYLRIVVGPRFAIMEAGLAMILYLVLFSYTFFLKGFTALTVTVGCVVTLFLVMQLTARIRWSERFVPRPA